MNKRCEIIIKLSTGKIFLLHGFIFQAIKNQLGGNFPLDYDYEKITYFQRQTTEKQVDVRHQVLELCLGKEIWTKNYTSCHNYSSVIKKGKGMFAKN